MHIVMLMLHRHVSCQMRACVLAIVIVKLVVCALIDNLVCTRVKYKDVNT
jgi:hypothetical protein